MVTNRLDLTPSTSIYKASQFTKKVCDIGDYLREGLGWEYADHYSCTRPRTRNFLKPETGFSADKYLSRARAVNR